MLKRPRNLSNKVIKWVGSKNSILAHTVFFALMFSLAIFGVPFDKVLLILTTIVSLEAIYLAIFIQFTVNRHAEDLVEVSEDIDEIQEDVEGIEKDIDEIQEDVGELQEDVEEMSVEEETNQNSTEIAKLVHIEKTLQSLLEEISKLKK